MLWEDALTYSLIKFLIDLFIQKADLQWGRGRK